MINRDLLDVRIGLLNFLHLIFSSKRALKIAMGIIILFITGMDSSHAQDSVFTFQTAVRIALEKNFDIRIASNDLTKLKQLDHPGEAGMLPELNLNGAYNRADNTTKQKYSNGDVVDRKNAITENVNAEAQLSWTVFDGLKMFSTRKKLAELSAQGEVALKMQMEDVYLKVIQYYFEISRQQQLLRSIQEEIVLARERLVISERRFKNGSGSRLDLLHSKTDLNGRLSAGMTQEAVLSSAIIELNRLLALAPESKYTVEDSVVITYNPSLADLNRQSEQLNSVRSYYRKELIISELSLKESGSRRWPQVKLNGNYVFSRTNNDAGFILLNNNQGYNYGITASVPLFSGFQISHHVKNARLDVINSRLKMEQVEEEIKAGLLIAYQNFQDVLAILQLEEENIVSSREILIISQERFKSGLSTILELKVAQSAFEDDMSRLVNARFFAKVAEGKLKQLSGELIRD